MNRENPPPTDESFGTRLISGFFNLARIFVRFVVLALLIALLALLVFGIPFVYWRFVTPAISEFKHIATAQVEQQQVSQRMLDKLQDIQQRLDTLELRLDTEKQQIGEINQAVEGLASTQQAYSQQFLETQIALENTIQSIFSEIDSQSGRLSEISETLELHEKRVDSVVDHSQELEDRLLSDDEPINRLRRDVELMKVMEFLTRSRLFIYQDNLGLAQDELVYARETLSNLEVPEEQSEIAAEVIGKMDQALEYLPDSPDLAVGELEIAWQIIYSRLFSGTVTTPAATSSLTPASLRITQTPPIVGTISATPVP